MKRTLDTATLLESEKKMQPESADACTEEEKTKPVVGIHSLPPELLSLVFSFLSPSEIHNNVTKVCTNWSEFLYDPSIYRVFEFKTLHEDLRSKISYLRLAPWLVSLTLENQVDTTSLLEAVCMGNYRLQYLTLTSCRGSPSRLAVNASTLKKLIKKCPQLRELKFNDITGLTKVFNQQVGWRLPHLRIVHFINTHYFGSEAVLNLAEYCTELVELRACHKYQTMDLGVTFDVDIQILCRKLGRTLKRLELNGQMWTDVAFKALAECVNLEQLAVRFARKLFPNDLLRLGNLSNLTNLDLTFVTVPEETWNCAFSTTSFTKLKKLSLIMCNITNRVAGVIAANLKGIEWICLSGIICLTRVGLDVIIKGCPTLTHMELLFMEGQIHQSLMLLPQHLPNLQKLVGTEDIIAMKAVLQRQMPKLVVEPVHSNHNDIFDFLGEVLPLNPLM